MKISALVSVATASRQARDAQSLFNKTFGDQSDNVAQRNLPFPETDSLYQVTQFYASIKGKILKSFAGTVH